MFFICYKNIMCEIKSLVLIPKLFYGNLNFRNKFRSIISEAIVDHGDLF